MWEDPKLIEILKRGGVVVMPTDTIYGLAGVALNEPTVNRIYTVRKRNPEKPCIILIGAAEDLEKFSIDLSLEQKKVLETFWPGPVSIILDCEERALAYLHCGTKTLAFGLPASESLGKLLLETGPLIAPSANPEGLPPAKNITEAKNYFGEAVDLYIDGGEIVGKPSKLIKLSRDGSFVVLRD